VYTKFCWGNLRKRSLGIKRVEVRCTQGILEKPEGKALRINRIEVRYTQGFVGETSGNKSTWNK
jgi:hypothetical protein